MIYSITYSMGDNTKHQYFEHMYKVKDFIEAYMKVANNDSCSFEISVYKGKEEVRIRRFILAEEK